MERQRVTRLIEYVNGLNDNSDGRELYAEYKNEIEAVKPQEAFEVFKSLLDDNVPPKDILIFLDKAINAFYNSLINYKWQRPSNDNFLKDMLLENEALVKKTDEIKSLMKVGDLKTKKESILKKIKELEEFDHHYLKKENILFPYMEKKMEKFEGLKIMWSLHDIVRNQIKTAEDVLGDECTTEQQVNSAIATLFFGILGVKKKEELILFPAASEVLSEEDWDEMHKQSLEYKFPFIGESVNAGAVSEAESDLFSNGRFKTDTGELTFDEILMVFGALPVDLTFVDENNRVRFFTKPKDRIFPRSAAVIGRDVKNCHPPESVHVVEEIIESFRSGRETTAKFWINMKGKIILIQYFALFDSSGKYRGVLEASQDITEIKSLDGERRLLKWERQ
ncbi:MAG TPA: PAS sensor protein [Clostridiales bacterium]|nr:PAS sensor protein [Clostridiales bacterium]